MAIAGGATGGTIPRPEGSGVTYGVAEPPVVPPERRMLEALCPIGGGLTVPLPPRLWDCLASAADVLRDELNVSPTPPMAPLSVGLTLLAAGVGEPDPRRVGGLAAAMEMIWTAILSQWAVTAGNAADLMGILTSDYVLSRALFIITSDADPVAMSSVSAGAVGLCEGVMYGAEQPGEYTELARGVARHLEACCRVGAAAAHLPPDLLGQVGRFGFEAGLSLCMAGPPPKPPSNEWLQNDGTRHLLHAASWLAVALARPDETDG